MAVSPETPAGVHAPALIVRVEWAAVASEVPAAEKVRGITAHPARTIMPRSSATAKAASRKGASSLRIPAARRALAAMATKGAVCATTDGASSVANTTGMAIRGREATKAERNADPMIRVREAIASQAMQANVPTMAMGHVRPVRIRPVPATAKIPGGEAGRQDGERQPGGVQENPWAKNV